MERQVDSANIAAMEATVARTALALVDLQPVFLDMMTDGENLRRRCSLLLEAAALTGMKVHLTEQVPDKLGGFDERLTAMAEPTTCFPKATFSAFGAVGFEDALRSDGTEHLLVGGVETSICVYQTALDALRAGFEVTILTDCVSCRREADGVSALRALRESGCHALPLETVFYSMIQTAEHPLFRDFSKLIRKYDS